MPSSPTSTPEEGVRVYSIPPEAGARIPYDTWELSTHLLTTLELERVIDLFAHWVAKDLRQKSLGYRHDEHGIFFSVGAPSRHSINYRLVLGETSLGELSLTREKRFSSEEIRWLERQICGLVYALRNALRFWQAAGEGLDPFAEQSMLRKAG